MSWNVIHRVQFPACAKEKQKPMQKKPNQETAGVHLLSQTALAKALKVCPVTVSRWTTARIIPCHRVGAKFVRYDLAAVLAAIAKAENKKGGNK